MSENLRNIFFWSEMYSACGSLEGLTKSDTRRWNQVALGGTAATRPVNLHLPSGGKRGVGGHASDYSHAWGEGGGGKAHASELA